MATKSSSSEKRFRSIFEMAKEAVIVIDVHSVVSQWNPGAEAMFGYSADEMLDGSMLKIIPPQYHDRHLKAMERIIETGEFGGLVGTTFEVSAMRRDGHEFPIERSTHGRRTVRFFAAASSEIFRNGRKCRRSCRMPSKPSNPKRTEWKQS